MNYKDVRWEIKSYGFRANIFSVRLFIHTGSGLRCTAWGADYDPNWAPSVHQQMNTAVRTPSPVGITHVSGEADDVEKAKMQAFLAAKLLLGTKLTKKGMSNAESVGRKRPLDKVAR